MNTSDMTSNSASSVASQIIERLRVLLSSEQQPAATYRWQFHSHFTFREAAKWVRYLRSLGVSHVYASPFLRARSGSMHGYDLVDHTKLNPELGGDAGFVEYATGLKSCGLGQILDVVPNHMGVGSDENAWWQDVLENGPSSPYASCFDIDWRPLKPDLDNKVLLPVLGDQFGTVLEDGQLVLQYDSGTFVLKYFGRRFPLAPRSFGQILRYQINELQQLLGEVHPAFLEYQSILTAISHLPPREETEPEKLIERNREKEIIKGRLARLCEDETRVAEFVMKNVSIFNGRRAEPRSFDLLDKLLQDQAYRLSFWRVAADEINYRRFFDVNELAAVCMERPDVFNKAHKLVLHLLERGDVQGLRIDHADGLFDPAGYLWQLQERRFLQRCRELFDQPAGVKSNLNSQVDCPSWNDVEPLLRSSFSSIQAAASRTDPIAQSVYLVVEKILERSEKLPDNWPVRGTSGYEFLNQVNVLFVDPESAAEFDSLYSDFIGEDIDFGELVCRSKKLIMKVSMSSELNVLGHQLDRISERHRASRDFTRNGLTYALREVVSCFPVYRTYATPVGVLTRDHQYIERAVARAKRQNPATSIAVFDFIRDVLLLSGYEAMTEVERSERFQFVGRFQQFTGPVMAKSVEDTSFYSYNRLVSLNEVGGDPTHFGSTIEEFHRQNEERLREHPFSLLATSTHDTKRGEDVRARINVISEIPQRWRECINRWTKWNDRHKTNVDGELVPSRNDEYLLYQTLVGTWPFVTPTIDERAVYITRVHQYMTKAIREAKVRSSWIAPNELYECATEEFITAILCDESNHLFHTDFAIFASETQRLGMWNSLSQLLLKFTCPGVPDIYQGTELWDLSLVDPDNRRPIDYGYRLRLLNELDQLAECDNGRERLAENLTARAADGRIKLYVTVTALRLRHLVPDLFTQGEYVPLEVSGKWKSHLYAFARRRRDQVAIVVVPRLLAKLLGLSVSAPIGQDVWGDTVIHIPTWLRTRHIVDAFTNRRLTHLEDGEASAADILRKFPVALLSTL